MNRGNCFDLRNSLRILELPVGRAQTRRAWRLPFSMGSRYEFVYDLFGDSLPVEDFQFMYFNGVMAQRLFSADLAKNRMRRLAAISTSIM
jgi:hypothetical protein